MNGREAAMSKWTDKLSIADIPEQYQDLARIIGVQNLLKLADAYGGYKPYIPKREALLRNARDRMIRKQFTGYNTRELARYYDLTDRRIVQICKGGDADEGPEEAVKKLEGPKKGGGDGPQGEQYALWKCI